jgi:hypothetical protein
MMKRFEEIVADLPADQHMLATLNQRIDEFHAALAKVRIVGNELATAKNLHWGHIGSLAHIVEVLEELAGDSADSD